MNKSFADFKKGVIGKGFDVDHAYGNQCWDGAMKYFIYWNYPIFNCTRSGYAKDVWELKETSGILEYFRVKDTPKVGDVVVFKESRETPSSHIGMVSKVKDNTIVVLGQNQGGKHGAFNEIELGKKYAYGYLRPVALTNDSINSRICNFIPQGFVKEKGSFKVELDKLRIFEAPNTSVAKNSGLFYQKNDVVNYDGYIINDGYKWISWISLSTGKRRWLKSGRCNAKGYITYPYGRFM